MIWSEFIKTVIWYHSSSVYLFYAIRFNLGLILCFMFIKLPNNII